MNNNYKENNEEEKDNENNINNENNNMVNNYDYIEGIYPSILNNSFPEVDNINKEKYLTNYHKMNQLQVI